MIMVPSAAWTIPIANLSPVKRHVAETNAILFRIVILVVVAFATAAAAAVFIEKRHRVAVDDRGRRRRTIAASKRDLYRVVLSLIHLVTPLRHRFSTSRQ